MSKNAITEPATGLSTKDDVMEFIRQMPDDLGIDELLDRLQVRYEIERGLRELDAGDSVTHDEVKQRVAAWHK